MKDWTGNNKSAYTCLGASNHSTSERQVDDYYATEPKATELLLEVETFSNDVLDPFMGSGTVGKACQKLGRDFIGVEIDENYFNLAKEYLNDNQ